MGIDQVSQNLLFGGQASFEWAKQIILMLMAFMAGIALLIYFWQALRN
jgi:hypothetical protein